MNEQTLREIDFTFFVRDLEKVISQSLRYDVDHEQIDGQIVLTVTDRQDRTLTRKFVIKR